MPALTSTREGYLQSPIRETGSFLVLASHSGFECGQSGPVLLASGRVTVVTSVTTLWKGVLDLWSGHARVFSRVYGVSPRGCCGFVVTVVILVTSRTLSICESGWGAGSYLIRTSELTSRQRASTGTRQRAIHFPHPRSSTYRERETRTLRRYLRWVHVTASVY